MGQKHNLYGDLIIGGSLGANALTVSDFAVNTDTLLVDSENSRVGVGTSTPSQLFHVAGSNGNGFVGARIENTVDNNLNGKTGIEFKFANGYNAGKIWVGKDTTYYSSNWATRRTNMEFYTTYLDTEKIGLRINYAQDVQMYKGLTIYQSATATYLKVKATDYNTPVFSLLTNYSPGYINFRYGGGSGLKFQSCNYDESGITDRITLTSGGNLLIGTTTNSGDIINASGSINAENGYKVNGASGYTGTVNIDQSHIGLPPIQIEINGGIITNVI